jgi:hypothetical protein
MLIPVQTSYQTSFANSLGNRIKASAYIYAVGSRPALIKQGKSQKKRKKRAVLKQPHYKGLSHVKSALPFGQRALLTLLVYRYTV